MQQLFSTPCSSQPYTPLDAYKYSHARKYLSVHNFCFQMWPLTSVFCFSSLKEQTSISCQNTLISPPKTPFGRDLSVMSIQKYKFLAVKFKHHAGTTELSLRQFLTQRKLNSSCLQNSTVRGGDPRKLCSNLSLQSLDFAEVLV